MQYLLAKEFVLYIDHQALQYINNQAKLNKQHMKWVEFLQSCSFLLKYNSRRSNRVANALSKIALLTTMTLEMVGPKEMKNLYGANVDFAKAWKASKEPCIRVRTPFLDYFIKKGLLFKN
jgi:hypothetical protein